VQAAPICQELGIEWWRHLVVTPYVDVPQSVHEFVRVFDHSVPATELVWHRDRKNRRIRVVRCEGWQLQFDNCLPQALVPGQQVEIGAKTWHRVIKGEGDLEIEITEWE
jgi:hypothetical protein